MLRDPHSECVILLHCCGDLGRKEGGRECRAGGGEGKEGLRRNSRVWIRREDRVG